MKKARRKQFWARQAQLQLASGSIAKNADGSWLVHAPDGRIIGSRWTEREALELLEKESA